MARSRHPSASHSAPTPPATNHRKAHGAPHGAGDIRDLLGVIERILIEPQETIPPSELTPPRRSDYLRALLLKVIRFNEFELDLDVYELRKGSEKISFSGRALDVLIHLIRNRDRVVSKDELRQDLWESAHLSASAIPTAIMDLRRALGDDASAPRTIGSIRGRGYRFLPEVVTDEDFSAETLRFVGRSAELGALIDTAREVRSRRSGKTVVISGEAGIGKTRLLGEFISLSTKDFLQVISKCALMDGAPPFWPWTQAIANAMDTDSPRDSFRSLAQELAAIHPEITGPTAPEVNLNRPPDRFSLFNLWIAAFRELAQDGPMILAFEDIHLADADSLDLLSCLVEEVEDVPIMIVATHRPPSFNDQRADRIGQIGTFSSTRSLRLSPLTEDDLVSILGPSDTRNRVLGRTLQTRTQGIPFYVAQLLRHASTKLAQGHSIECIAKVLPLSGQEIVTRQLSDLPTETRSTLAVGALFGDRFPASLLADVLNKDVKSITNELDSAVRTSLIQQRSTEFEFSHSLLREALASTLEPVEQREFHLAIARQLQHRSHALSRTAQIADQLSRALPLGDPSEAIHFSTLAGREARSRFAYGIAVTYLQRALKLEESLYESQTESRCRLMQELAICVLYAGDRDESRRLLLDAAEIARTNGHSELLAHAAIKLAPDFLSIEVGVNDTLRIMLLEEALNSLPHESASLRAIVTAHLSQAIRWTRNPQDVQDLASKSLVLAERTRDGEATIAALSAVTEALHGPTRSHDRLQTINRLAEIEHSSPTHASKLLRHTHAIATHLELGDIRSVELENERYRALSEQIELPQYQWYPLAHDAMLAMMRGDIDKAEHLSAEFRKIAGRSPDQNCLQTFAGQQVVRSIELDRASEVTQLIEAIAESQPWTYYWRVSVPWIYVETNRLQEAAALARRFTKSDVDFMAREPGGGLSLAGLAEVLVKTGEFDLLPHLYSILELVTDRCAMLGYGVGYFGSLARYAGIVAIALGELDAATAHLTKASEQERDREAPSWFAYAEIDLCTALSATGTNDASLAERLTRVSNELSTFNLPRARRKLDEATSALGSAARQRNCG